MLHKCNFWKDVWRCSQSIHKPNTFESFKERFLEQLHQRPFLLSSIFLLRHVPKDGVHSRNLRDAAGDKNQN